MDIMEVFYSIIFKLDKTKLKAMRLSRMSTSRLVNLIVVPVEFVNSEELFWGQSFFNDNPCSHVGAEGTRDMAYLQKPISLIVPETIRNELINAHITVNNNNVLDHFIYVDDALCKILASLNKSNEIKKCDLMPLDNFYYQGFTDDVFDAVNNCELYNDIISHIPNVHIVLNHSQYDVIRYEPSK